MTACATPTVDSLSDPAHDAARLYQEGMIAGVIGAATPPAPLGLNDLRTQRLSALTQVLNSGVTDENRILLRLGVPSNNSTTLA
jgi:hypothetical protein